MQNIILKISRTLLTLPRYVKRLAAVICDIVLCVIALWLAYYLRLDEFMSLRDNTILVTIIIITIAIPVFWLSGLYQTMFRYSGKSSIIAISFAIFIYGLLFFSIIAIYGISGVPRSIGIIQPLVLFFAIALSRLGIRFLFGETYQSKETVSSLPNALVYGAGSAGRQLVSSLDNNYEMRVAGFIDDNELLHGQIVQGKTIFSPAKVLSKKLRKRNTTKATL